MTAGRIVIAGAQSGVGKTTIATAIMGALRRRGRDVRPFKAGPDYIDPSYHTAVCGRASRNLDSWMLTDDALLELFGRATAGDCVAVVEGVMGLFDGSSEPGAVSPRGSTASLAKLLGAPVVVVLDVRGAAQSAAAMALGYQRLDPDLRVAGFILNRIGSEGHYRLCAESIRQATGLPTFGYFPRDEALALPERHLGLIPTGEHKVGPEFFERVIAQAERTIDLEGVERISLTSVPSPATRERGAGKRGEGLFPPLHRAERGSGGQGEADGLAGPPVRTLFPAGVGQTPTAWPGEDGQGTGLCPTLGGSNAQPFTGVPPSRVGKGDRGLGPPVRLALALDEAFGFYYEDNLDLLRAWGAEIVPFSPLADSALPDCDGVYLGGGFPELFARDLAANRAIMIDLASAAGRGMPFYAECGGLMYLCEGITDLDGQRHRMAGLVPGWSSLPGERLSLGYATVTARDGNLLLPAGAGTRGHEFHWSRIDRVDADTAAWTIAEQPGRAEGYARGSVLASYIHLHFGANPALAPAFVDACARYREARTAR